MAHIYENRNNSRSWNNSFLYPHNYPMSTVAPTYVINPPPSEGRLLITNVSFALLRYVLPVIIAVGTFGNVLSIVVIVRKRMLGKSVYFYLLSLACADTAVLYVSALKTWVRAAFGVEFLHVSPAACKTLMFLLVLALHMSAWLVVFVTSDRFVAVWFPLKAAIFCTTKRAAIVTVLCLVIMVIYNLQLFWTIHLQVFPEQNYTKCGPYATDHFHNYTYNYLKFATYSLIPFGIVLIFNVGIVMKLKRDSPALRNAQSGGRHEWSRAAAQMETQRRLTYMLLTVSFSWLVLTVPFTLFSLFPSTWFYHEEYKYAPGQLIKVISFLLMYINHSTNFYLYCLTGRKFRQEAADILCLSKLIKRRRTLRSSTHMTHFTRAHTGDQSVVGYTSASNGIPMKEL